MRRTPLFLTLDQITALKAIAARTGESVSAVARRAFDEYLSRQRPADRLQALRSVRGMWKGRKDMPNPRSATSPGEKAEA
jgi:hypothetical protein